MPLRTVQLRVVFKYFLVLIPYCWSVALEKKNDYPPELTNKCLHSKSRQKPTEDEDRPPTLNTPYIKGFSEKLERACRPLKIRTTFSSKRTLRTELVHVKGQIMADKQKGVVYRVNCNTCNQTYIRETGRTLKVRLKEHHRAVNVSDTNNGIAVHANEHDHPVDWSSAKILHKETNFIKRKVVEALHISETKHTMNLDQGLRLNPTWQTLTIAFVSFHFFVFSLMKDFGPKRLS